MEGRRESQGALQVDLPWRGVEQIGAPDNMRDALCGVVDDHRQGVRDDAVAALHDEVADRGADILAEAALNQVRKVDVARIHPQTRAGGSRLGGAFAARARVMILVGELPAAAAAREQQLRSIELRKRLGIQRLALRLTNHRTVPFEAECGERGTDAIRRTRDFARPVEILDSDDPPSAVRARIEIARDRRIQ